MTSGLRYRLRSREKGVIPARHTTDRTGSYEDQVFAPNLRPLLLMSSELYIRSYSAQSAIRIARFAPKER